MDTNLIGTIISFAGHYEFDYETVESRIINDEKIFQQGVKNASNLASQGWLLCNGKAIFVNDSQLSQLFNVIGSFWGDGDSPNTAVNPFPYFRIPDLCGLFARGALSSKTHRDPDVKNRKRIYSKDRPNPYVSCPGSYQSDEFKSHTHLQRTNRHGYANQSGCFDYSGAPVGAAFENTSEMLQNSGGSETRPINVYVNYLIKASDKPIDIKKLYKDNEILNDI